MSFVYPDRTVLNEVFDSDRFAYVVQFDFNLAKWSLKNRQAPG